MAAFAVGAAGANIRATEITAGETPPIQKNTETKVSVFVGHPGLEPGTSRL